jgi:hypothetical protein
MTDAWKRSVKSRAATSATRPAIPITIGTPPATSRAPSDAIATGSPGAAASWALVRSLPGGSSVVDALRQAPRTTTGGAGAPSGRSISSSRALRHLIGPSPFLSLISSSQPSPFSTSP